MDAPGIAYRPLFGLKWKALIVLSVVLASVNASLAYLVYAKSSGQFEAEQQSRRLSQVREFEAMLAKGFESMSAFATLVPRLAASPVGWGVSQPNRLAAALEEHGPILDLEWGVEGVHYFRTADAKTPAFSWPSGRRPPWVGSLLEVAARDEVPQGRLVCAVHCVQLVVLPVLQQGATIGLLVVERSIGDTLKEFHLLSGAEVLIMRPSQDAGSGEQRRLADWDRRVAAITHEELVLPLVQYATGRMALAEVIERPRRLEFAADWYELFALPTTPGAAETTVLLINRVTSQVQAIREATEDSLLLGLGGLVISELILLLLLWGPVQRIQRVVHAFPLLAEKQYAQLRDDLSGIAHNGAARDEIDVMVRVIGAVSSQIESLDKAHLEAEQALRASEQNLRQAQSMARVASWTGRPLDGYFVFGQGARRISPVLAHVSNWAELLALVHPEDRRELLKAWRSGRPGASMDIEFRLVVGDRQIDIHAMADFEAIGRERVLCASGMMQDISEMRAVQRALKSHRDQLEEEVRQRTTELVAARNQAERLAQSKGRFLANMSHEIRTPLNAVLGLSQVGLRQGDNPQVMATFEQIIEAGGHLLNVVNDVLDISKLEAGKLVINPGPFEPREVIRQCTDMLRQRAEAKSLSLRVSIADDVPNALVGDSFRLQQILINLLSNAVKFTEHGAVSLEVDRDGDSYAFAVRDTGVGMSADQVGRLFAPFQQVGGQSGGHREGTGLGLSISIALATMMGGDIRVRSRPDEGSVFVLQLPLQSATVARRVEQAAVTPPAGEFQLAGMRVLVADDVAINRKIVEALLEAEGARVTTVDNGREAVEAVLRADGEGFDIVLMDVEMPEVDGRHATREIRLAGIEVPIVGLTAHVSADERIASLAAGMHDQLVKPVMRQTLVETILNYRDKVQGALTGGQLAH